MKIYIRTDFSSPRLQYVLHEILERRWNVNFILIKDDEQSEDFPLINYSIDSTDISFFNIPNFGLLNQKGIAISDIHHKQLGDKHFLFFSDQTNFSLPFDIFSAIFWMLSRHEEYTNKNRDQHGRFTAKSSIAFKKEYLEIPVVDYWIEELRQKIENHFDINIATKHSFKIKPTIDIDLPWAFKNKSIIKNLGGLSRDGLYLKMDLFTSRLKYFLSNKKDPFDTYELMSSLFKKLDPVYFFLMRCEGEYDRNEFIDDKEFQELVKQISKENELGIHPSYSSNQSKVKLAEEIKLLEKNTEKTITKSRQHYLKLDIPSTYRQLIAQGIVEDYSMGFADAIGFRAGTSLPFRWYDLENEQSTTLTIHPFCVMDVTLKDYHHYSVDQAIDSILKIKKSVKQTNGTFSFIWHNSSFSSAHGWVGWQKVLEMMLQIG